MPLTIDYYGQAEGRGLFLFLIVPRQTRVLGILKGTIRHFSDQLEWVEGGPFGRKVLELIYHSFSPSRDPGWADYMRGPARVAMYTTTYSTLLGLNRTWIAEWRNEAMPKVRFPKELTAVPNPCFEWKDMEEALNTLLGLLYQQVAVMGDHTYLRPIPARFLPAMETLPRHFQQMEEAPTPSDHFLAVKESVIHSLSYHRKVSPQLIERRLCPKK